MEGFRSTLLSYSGTSVSYTFVQSITTRGVYVPCSCNPNTYPDDKYGAIFPKGAEFLSKYPVYYGDQLSDEDNPIEEEYYLGLNDYDYEMILHTPPLPAERVLLRVGDYEFTLTMSKLSLETILRPLLTQGMHTIVPGYTYPYTSGSCRGEALEWFEGKFQHNNWNRKAFSAEENMLLWEFLWTVILP